MRCRSSCRICELPSPARRLVGRAGLASGLCAGFPNQIGAATRPDRRQTRGRSICRTAHVGRSRVQAAGRRPALRTAKDTSDEIRRHHLPRPRSPRRAVRLLGRPRRRLRQGGGARVRRGRDLPAGAGGASSPSSSGRCWRNTDLKLAAVGTGAGWVKHKLRLTAPDAGEREQAKQFVRGDHRRGRGAGRAGHHRLDAGPVGRRRRARRRRWTWLADALQDLGEHARRYGVPLIYEPLNRYETNLVNDVADGVKLIEQSGCDNVKLLADLFHMNIEEADLARGDPRRRAPHRPRPPRRLQPPAGRAWVTPTSPRSPRRCGRSATPATCRPRRSRTPTPTRRRGTRSRRSAGIFREGGVHPTAEPN